MLHFTGRWLWAALLITGAETAAAQVQLRALPDEAWGGDGLHQPSSWVPCGSGDAAFMLIQESSGSEPFGLATWQAAGGYEVIAPGQDGYHIVYQAFASDGRRALFHAQTQTANPWVDAHGVFREPGSYVWDRSAGILPIPPFVGSGGTETEVQWEVMSGNGLVLSGTAATGEVVVWDGVQPPQAVSWGIDPYARPVAADFSGQRQWAVTDFPSNQLWEVRGGAPVIYELNLWGLMGSQLQVVSSDGETLLMGDGFRTYLWTPGSDPVPVGSSVDSLHRFESSYRADRSEVVFDSQRVHFVDTQDFVSTSEYWSDRRAYWDEGSFTQHWYSGSPERATVVVFEPGSAAAQLYAAYFPTPPGYLGENYCGPSVRNSTGAPAYLNAAGSLQVGDHNLTLLATSLPNDQFGYLLNSLGRDFVEAPAGSMGRLCLGGGFPIGRHQGPGEIGYSGAFGQIATPVNLESVPTPFGDVAAQAGQSWFFQLWYRDHGPGGSTSNFTDAVSVTLP